MAPFNKSLVKEDRIVTHDAASNDQSHEVSSSDDVSGYQTSQKMTDPNATPQSTTPELTPQLPLPSAPLIEPQLTLHGRQPVVSSDSTSTAIGSKPEKNWLSGKLGVLVGIGIGLILGVVVIPRLIGSTQLSRADTASDRPTDSTTASSIPSPAVTIATVEPAQIQRSMEATGTVVPYDLLPISAKASGLQIQRVLVDEGDRIVVGQPLVQLDQSIIKTQIAGAEADLEAARARVIQREAALAQAKARFTEAQANLKRYDDLASQGAVSEQEFDTRATTAATAQEDIRVAEANIRSALADVRREEAQIKQLQTQLGQATVTAPANGIVAERLARVGDVTSSSQSLFTVIRDRLLELDVNVPETQLSAIRLGSTVAIRSDADPQLQLQGQVREISPLIDPQTREASVKIDLPDSLKLRSGMFLQATLSTGVVQGLTIPAAAVLPQSDGNALVYQVSSDQQVQSQSVVLGELLDGETPETATIEILQGLQAGDRIVVEGASYLKDGDSVNIVPN